MGSFRKRLLVLIIGLVIVTQTVTLAAVLASTRRTVEARSCGAAALRGRRSPISWCASAPGSWRTASRCWPRTSASARRWPAATCPRSFRRRATTRSASAPTWCWCSTPTARCWPRRRRATAAADGSLASLLDGPATARASSRSFRVFGAHAYQFFLAPVRTPETIAWVAMGFVADDTLAQKIRELVGSEVQIVTHGSRRRDPRRLDTLAAARHDGSPASAICRRRRRSSMSRASTPPST